ncbi:MULTISPECIES: four helix bundle protein [Nostoc]|uniref:Four helix bundle protein n=1 Tax=Nostoc paludosum FACHB-159 TaxID=2692908 RepID=A0ABR8KHM2_9NOSO|nr:MULTISPECIES: four helix bundle protein [Nostoc]MBD2682699.1 four helix bundle protein [Nostoc sp. FACHB-857]MBD2739033.1 four helix bundle protein [Nostoc paludosum FACHB-159]
MEEKEGKIYFRTHEDLAIYQLAFETAMQIFEHSKKFPVEEKYSLTDQIRRSSRSVCANLAEARRKRRYKAAFVAKLNDCEAEAAETQVWLKFAVKCQYLTVEQGRELYIPYNQILSGLVKMISHPDDWLLS